MNRQQVIQDTLKAIGQKNKELQKKRGTYIREKYRHVPLLLKLLSDKKSLERPELAELAKHRYIIISHGQIIPSMKGYRHLYAYLMYLESTGASSGSDYGRLISSLFGAEPG